MVMGGMQKHSYYLAKYLALKVVEVELHTMVWTREDADHPLPFTDMELQKITVITHLFPSSWKFPGHYLYRSYLLSRAMYNAIADRLTELDFIYTKGFTGWELLRRRKRGLKTVIGVKLHGMNMFLPTHGFRQRLEQLILRPPARWIMHRADVVFSYGGKVTDTILKAGVPRNKIAEVPTGIESNWIRHEIKASSEMRKVVFIGRYDPVKGIRELNEVLRTESFDALKFDFIGPFERSVRLDLPNVQYHGVITDQNMLRDLLDESDALILPSYSEGMPNVVLEAMARGLVILATEVGALTDLVGNQSGFVIKSPSVESLRKVLQELQEASEEQLDAMKQASIDRVRSGFLWEVISDKLLDQITASVSHDI